MAQPAVPGRAEGVAGNPNWEAHQGGQPWILIQIGVRHGKSPRRSDCRRFNILSEMPGRSSPPEGELLYYSTRSGEFGTPLWTNRGGRGRGGCRIFAGPVVA